MNLKNLLNNEVNYKTNKFWAVIAFAVSVASGLILMVSEYEKLSAHILITAIVISPVSLAAKGIEFMIENQFWKASLSFLMLSVICILSNFFVFA